MSGKPETAELDVIGHLFAAAQQGQCPFEQPITMFLQA